MATNDESIDARNNIAYVTAAGANLQLLDSFGRLTLTQNWFKTGWTPFAVSRPKGTITNNGTITGASPGFVSEAGQDYHLIVVLGRHRRRARRSTRPCCPRTTWCAST